MFDLGLSDEQEAIRKTLRAFCDDRVRSVAEQAEIDPALAETLLGELHALGVTRPVDVRFGGQGIPDRLTMTLIAEELAWGDPGVACAALIPGHAGLMIDALGSEAQKERYLPRFATDPALRPSLLLHEGFGRSPSELQTLAAPQGGPWSITGDKVAVLFPGSADLLVVVARHAETGELLAFLVDHPAPAGLAVARDDSASGKLGLNAAPTGCVELRKLEVDDTGRLGGDPGLLHREIASVRLTMAAIALGTARAALAYAIDYARDRVAFGRPISEYQGVSFPLADVEMTLDAARLTVWKAVTELDRFADGPALESATTAAVSTACRVAVDATRKGINTLGGHGFLADHPLERWYRAAATLAAIDFDPLAADLDLFS